jgi:hypothetical protein
LCGGIGGPRQELVDTRGRPQIDELGENVGDIGFRVDAVELAGLCRLPNYAERFWEEPVVCAYLRARRTDIAQFHSA